MSEYYLPKSILVNLEKYHMWHDYQSKPFYMTPIGFPRRVTDTYLRSRMF